MRAIKLRILQLAEALARDCDGDLVAPGTMDIALFLPFTGLLARLLIRILPERPEPVESIATALYLDESLLGVPALSLAAARQEIGNLGQIVAAMIESATPLALSGSRGELEKLRLRDRDVDALHAQLIDYLRRSTQAPMTTRQSREEHVLHKVVNALEHMGDIAEMNLVDAGLDRLDRDLTVFPGTREKIEALHREVGRAVRLAVDACVSEDIDKAEAVVKMKPEVKTLAQDAAMHQKRRLVADAPRRVETFTFENEVIESLNRVYYFAKRLARELLTPEEETEETLAA